MLLTGYLMIYMIIGLLIFIGMSLREGMKVDEIVLIPLWTVLWAPVLIFVWVDNLFSSAKMKNLGNKYIIPPPKCKKKGRKK